MPLTAAALTELTVESGTKALLSEWLLAWFDGNAHDVGANVGVTFPALTADRVRFDQDALGGAAGTPLNGVEIRVTKLAGRVRKLPGGGTAPTAAQVQAAFDTVTLQFWVRARTGQTGASNLLADKVAQLLFALLNNPTTAADLAAKGIRRLKPRSPQPLQASDVALRIINCPAQLCYEVKS